MDYLRAETSEEAAAALAAAAGSARVLAGGTDLLVQMKSGAKHPGFIIDIKHIPGLREIRPEEGGFRIGAAVPCAALGEHAALAAAWPGVVEAAGLIGSTQVQGRCTLGGNLCNGSPAADSVPALVAAGAKARIVGPDGARDCPVAEIPTGPGKTSLGQGEFVESFFLPAPEPRGADAYLRFIPRSEMDIAVASAGVCLSLDGDGRIASARVALGAVGPTVIACDAAAEALRGSNGEAEVLERLAAACSDAASPIDDKRGTTAFRTEVVGVLARRAAAIALDRARSRT